MSAGWEEKSPTGSCWFGTSRLIDAVERNGFGARMFSDVDEVSGSGAGGLYGRNVYTGDKLLLVGDGVELGFVAGGAGFCGEGVRLWSVAKPVETVCELSSIRSNQAGWMAVQSDVLLVERKVARERK